MTALHNALDERDLDFAPPAGQQRRLGHGPSAPKPLPDDPTKSRRKAGLQREVHQRLVIAAPQDHGALAASPLGDLLIQTAEDGGRPRPVLRDVFPILAIALSAGAEAAVKRALAALPSLGTIPEVPIIRLDPASLDQTAPLIRDILTGSLSRLAGYATSLTAELAMLRREREVLFVNYRALEDAFRARSWEPLAEVFSHDPFVDTKDQGIAQILLESAVEQDLPVSSHGVAGFALHFRNTVVGGGDFIVTLDRVEAGGTVAEWVVPVAAIGADWNYFALHRSCDGSPGSLRLRLRARGATPPEPSLGHPVLNTRYAAHAPIDHCDLGHRPLALRVFTGLPGVRPTSFPNTFAPISQSHEDRTDSYRLRVTAMRDVTDVSVTPVVTDFQKVSYLEHENAIVCHPLAEGITAGALVGAVVPGTVRLSARAAIDHPEGQPAAVGLLLVPPAVSPASVIAALARDADVPDGAVFSGWRPVTSQQPINITILLDTPIQTATSLVVMSRAVGASVDFSWLKVSDLRLERKVDA